MGWCDVGMLEYSRCVKSEMLVMLLIIKLLLLLLLPLNYLMPFVREYL